MSLALLLHAMLICVTQAPADKPVELLWPDGAPGAVGMEDRDKPSITIWLPGAEVRNGAAVVVCPGGGYGGLANDHEGKQVAEWLNKKGVAAFVLKYRLGPRYHHPAPLQDAQRAMRTVRARAKEWNVDPKRVGIWGFSAGGHLASTAGTHFDDGMEGAKDAIDRVSCRPDFMILAYPVITLEPPYTHGGSRKNLLGDSPDPKLVESLCNQKQVTARTPPTFLFHTAEDKAVPIQNSEMFHDALKKAGVPCELVTYEKGVHGVGLAQKDPILSKWPDRLADWLEKQGVLKK